jgi:hypothetical protein
MVYGAPAGLDGAEGDDVPCPPSAGFFVMDGTPAGCGCVPFCSMRKPYLPCSPELR